MYNLIEYSDNYWKTLEILWKYYRDEPALTDTGAIKKFYVHDNNSALFKSKQKITGKIAFNGRKDVETAVPLKCVSNFRRTLEMLLISCEINLILTWSEKCVLSNDKKATTFTITDAKLYVPVLTLSTQDNAKLLEQLKSGFKKTINWNKYEPKVSAEVPNPFLDFLINPSIQRVNRYFVLSFDGR